MINENFAYLGIVIASLGGLIYFYKTLNGEVQPNRVTWFLWALAPLIAFAAQIEQGVGIQVWITFIFGFLPLLVFVASFVNKKSFWKITKLDLVFGLFSLVGLVLWQITGVGNVAIAFSIIADGMAAVPTIIKSYYYPQTENYFAYLTSAIGAAITLLTIKIWNFETFGFSLYILIVTVLLTVLIKFKIGKNNSPRFFKSK